jgi:predicted nucleic-acid-binding protein
VRTYHLKYTTDETVEKVINKLEETNEESLVSGTMIINTATKTYIKYSSDKDEIPITK